MTPIRRAAAALTLALPLATGTPAQADGFVLGSGQWTCGDVLRIAQGGSPLDRGQMFGWIMGYWSAVSFAENDAFVANMQRAGGQTIANITIAECRNQPPEAPLFLVTQGIVANSRAEVAPAGEPQQ